MLTYWDKYSKNKCDIIMRKFDMNREMRTNIQTKLNMDNYLVYLSLKLDIFEAIINNYLHSYYSYFC